MSKQLLWPAIKLAADAGVLAGGFPYAKNNWYVGANAPIFGRRVDTLAALFAIAEPGDIAFLGPQEYSEGNLVIPATLTNFTLIGAGGRGSSFIEAPSTAIEGLQVLADDVTLFNVGVAGGATSDYALKVGSQAIDPARFRAFGCKIEGPDGVALSLEQTGDALFDDCEFCWCGTAIQLDDGDVGRNTQLVIKNCRFHNFVTAGISALAASQVKNLQLLNNSMDQLEDGTEPTDFILLSDNANTGLIAGNQFAIASNAAAKLTIGTGLMWGPNGTEAGWSTTRPV